MISTEHVKLNDFSADDINDLVKLINEVYLVAEGGLWKNDLPRTTLEEVTSLLQQERVIVAMDEGKIVGSVVVTSLDRGETCSFGMLVADEHLRGKGIGRRLIESVNAYAKNNDFVRLQLELLEPEAWTHTSKQFLRNWYTGLGFVEVREESIDKMYPGLSDKLAVTCKFSIWHKPVGNE